jgi:hypothetical protein
MHTYRHIEESTMPEKLLDLKVSIALVVSTQM